MTLLLDTSNSDGFQRWNIWVSAWLCVSLCLSDSAFLCLCLWLSVSILLSLSLSSPPHLWSSLSHVSSFIRRSDNSNRAQEMLSNHVKHTVGRCWLQLREEPHCSGSQPPLVTHIVPFLSIWEETRTIENTRRWGQGPGKTSGEPAHHPRRAPLLQFLEGHCNCCFTVWVPLSWGPPPFFEGLLLPSWG